MAKQSKNTLTLSTTLLKHMANAGADHGYGDGGLWPPDGSHRSSLTAVEVNGADVFEWGGRKNGKKVPANSVRFCYRTELPDARVIDWKGERLVWPHDPNSVPETEDKSKGGKQRSRADIAIRRCNGQLESILGYVPENMGDAVQQVQQMIEEAEQAGTTLDVLVEVRVREEEYKNPLGKVTKTTRRHDYIQSVLAGPTAPAEEPQEEAADTDAEADDPNQLELNPEDETAADDGDNEAEVQAAPSAGRAPAPLPKKPTRRRA